MRFLSASLAAAAVLCAPALAQFTVVIPNGTAATEGSTSNAFPWGRGGTGIRIQTIYDSSNFTAQGVTYPVIISRLRWRPNTATSSLASSYASPGATVKLSTCPVDQSAVSLTMSNNQGADLTTCFNGPVSWPAATATTGPCPFLIDIPFTTNFIYDPNLGDLNIETEIPIQTFTGTGLQLDVDGLATTLASRAYLTTGYVNNGANNTATGTTLNHGVVVEVTYVPAAGLYAAFTATPTSGASPMLVQFTDHTFTSDPGGVTSWAWDLNGDSIIDSTLQNPSFTYSTCGSYNVSLTVTDASHSPNTLTRNNFIVTDNVTPSFTSSLIAGNTFQFTDTSSPAPTSWAWDLDGDNIIDSTLQNPVWTYTTSCTQYNVSLTVNRLCRGPFTATRAVVVTQASAQCTLMAGGNGNTSTTYVGNMFDLVVNNPQGISVCALTVTPYSFAGAFTCDVYVTPGTYVGNNLNAAVWRQIGTGSGTTNAGGFAPPTPSFVPMAQSFYLPPGNYGMAVYLSRSPLAAVNIAYTNGPVGPFGNADVTFIPSSATAPGIATLGLFSGAITASRVWNGQLHYRTNSVTGEPGYGFFAPGCAGTLGIPGNTASALPRLGQTLTVNLSRLNLNAAFFILGFSRSSSIFGPLPVDLTPYGAPGCFGRVSTDAVGLISGAGNVATFNLSIPNNPIYLGNQLYTQGLALDITNVLGGVTSDAAAFIVGL